jgi:hypothetical protein
MSKEIDFSMPGGVPFRFYKAMATSERFWGIMLNKTATKFVPVLMLGFHKGVLEGVQSGMFSKEDCGIYTSMLHTWKVFGIKPEYFYVPMEDVTLGGKTSRIAMPYVQLRQQNDIGLEMSRVVISLSDCMIFSELLNTPILLSFEAAEIIAIEIKESMESVDEQIINSIISFESGSQDKKD